MVSGPRVGDAVQAPENGVRAGRVVQERRDDHGPAAFLGEGFEEPDAGLAAGREHEHAAAGFAKAADARAQFVFLRQ